MDLRSSSSEGAPSVRNRMTRFFGFAVVSATMDAFKRLNAFEKLVCSGFYLESNRKRNIKVVCHAKIDEAIPPGFVNRAVFN